MDSEKDIITPTVYAPNLHLFAFHLWRGLTGESDSLASNRQQLWQKADEILQGLGFTERLHIPGYPNHSEEPPGAQINLHPHNQLELTGKLPNSDLTITGLLFAHRLYDSYSLTVNLRRPEQENQQKTAEVPISFWRNLNTERLIFLPNFVQSSLGQSLLLTAFLPELDRNKAAKDLQEFAYTCLNQIMPCDKITPPPLVKRGELFGSPIFEFGGQVLDTNMEGETEVTPHLLIYLFRGKFSSGKFEAAYWQFINLFYYRNKVISAYRETRKLHQETYAIYTKLEKKVRSFKKELIENTTCWALTEVQLEQLKMVLKELAALDLEYARLLRNYKHCQNTISINTKNYQVTLEDIVKILPQHKERVNPEDLDFFREFGTQTSGYFQSRISDELNYFVEGSNLSDKAIASIRGIVEIEQTQCDRRLEQQNETLEDQIQAVGVGIATGAIIASTSPLIFQQEEISFPWEASHGDRLHPFMLALLLSLGSAVVAWWVAKGLIGWGRKRRLRQKQDSKN
ncbi:hypothetical protein [Laspinema olomoucense]|uniref:hypothetical protein n=1 Tax=Laspinema olomoucense TaxID=3231600 RepID=UPI0021BB6B27|nr:hypothetical protein [Laspinema sp. D3c]MCT7994792.1 hypothetical protein [Laspinema sp. D3c]